MEDTQTLKQRIAELEQQNSDLNIELATAIEHGDSVDEELLLINDQLLGEIAERKKAQKTLEQLTTLIKREKQDLELLVEAITDHSDRLDLQLFEQFNAAQIESLTDTLTQLANRRHFNQHIHEEWRRSIRSKQPLALILIDVDHFKLYNDNYGHTMGDECLKHVAAAMKETCTRSVDFVSRYGGEEYAIVISNSNTEEAVYIAEALQRNIAKLEIPHKGSLTNEFVTVSIGLGVHTPSIGEHETDFINRVDHLLYGAKRKGRNCIEYKESNYF